MMKYLSLLLICLLSFSFTQEGPTVTVDENKRAQVLLIVNAPGTKDELFLKAKDWLYRTYKSGKTVQQLEDKEAGHILAHARTQSLPWKAGLGIVNDAGDFSYDLTLDFKDGKARLLMDNIYHQKPTGERAMLIKGGANLADTYPANWGTLGKKTLTEHWNEMQERTKAELVAIASSFQQAMSSNKSDW